MMAFYFAPPEHVGELVNWTKLYLVDWTRLTGALKADVKARAKQMIGDHCQPSMADFFAVCVEKCVEYRDDIKCAQKAKELNGQKRNKIDHKNRVTCFAEVVWNEIEAAMGSGAKLFVERKNRACPGNKFSPESSPKIIVWPAKYRDPRIKNVAEEMFGD
ncbi:hypothetical protein HDE_09497 [Halotydeus destructor]|nr:hypothetical protein HDE_09497 [Halotydeus destructor]